MHKRVEQPKETKSHAAANNVGHKKSNRQQGFGFIDNRPEAKRAAELNNHNVQQQQPIEEKEIDTIAPVQAKFIHQDFASLSNPVEMGGHYDLKVAGKKKGTKLSYPYYGYNYPESEVATKHKAMISMQDALIDIGRNAPQGSLTGNVVAASDKNKKKIEWTDPDDEQGYYPQEVDKYWPFAVAISVDYRNTSLTNKNSGQVDISAFFAPGKYGYITEVNSDISSYDIDINENAQRLQLHVPQNEDRDGTYSSEHSVGGVRDLVQDGIHMEDGDGADAWTKAVAEGARWRSVRVLTEKSLLTNTSKFYTLHDKDSQPYQPNDPQNPTYIQFQDLWVQWREFKNEWDISGESLANALHNNIEGSKNDIDLETLGSDTHNLGVV